jgi:hypothetical protein
MHELSIDNKCCSNKKRQPNCSHKKKRSHQVLLSCEAEACFQKSPWFCSTRLSFCCSFLQPWVFRTMRSVFLCYILVRRSSCLWNTTNTKKFPFDSFVSNLFLFHFSAPINSWRYFGLGSISATSNKLVQSTRSLS